MILTDAGPLVAMLDADDGSHGPCVAIMRKLPSDPLVTTWPCFTEAMYLLGSVGRYRYQLPLWQMIKNGKLVLHVPIDSEVNRMMDLMSQYQDLPMDMADASLVAFAERYGTKRIFTIDRDFHIYRLADGRALEVIR